jgi:tetratricopeptide (TPR) repeat protein
LAFDIVWFRQLQYNDRNINTKVLMEIPRFRQVAFMRKSLFFFISVIFFLSSCQEFVPASRLAEAYLTLGNLYFQDKNYPEAIKYYQLSMKLSPQIKAVDFNLALVYSESGKFKDAKDLLSKLDTVTNTDVMNALAYVEYKLGDIDKSLALFDAVLVINPRDLNALYNSAVILGSKGDVAVAMERLKIAAADNTSHAEVQLLLARTLWKDGKKNESMEYWGNFSKAPKRSYSGMVEYAGILMDMKMYLDAEKVFNELKKDSAATAELFFRQAYLYLACLGKYEEGIGALQLAVQKGFKDKAEFNKLLGEPELVQPQSVRDYLTKNNLL